MNLRIAFERLPLFRGVTETAKLQTHLALLRDEYVKLQRRLGDVERKYQVLLASTGGGRGGGAEDNFVSRLLKVVSDLYDRELYRSAEIYRENAANL